jgi:hypothetical protein
MAEPLRQGCRPQCSFKEPTACLQMCVSLIAGIGMRRCHGHSRSWPCAFRALPFSPFCLCHILEDDEQFLYTACTDMDSKGRKSVCEWTPGIAAVVYIARDAAAVFVRPSPFPPPPPAAGLFPPQVYQPGREGLGPKQMHGAHEPGLFQLVCGRLLGVGDGMVVARRVARTCPVRQLELQLCCGAGTLACARVWPLSSPATGRMALAPSQQQ